MLQSLLTDLIEVAKKDKKTLIALKNIAVKAKQYELAVSLREIEQKFFPETEQLKKEKSLSQRTQTILGMVGIQSNEATSWLLYHTFKSYFKLKGNFSVEDAVTLQIKREEIFGNE